MKILFFTTVLVLSGACLLSQEINRTVICTSDPHRLCANDGGSDTLFYYHMTPDSADGTVLVLLSGWFRNTKQVFQRTDLPIEAYKNGISTLIPTINSRIHSDTVCFNLINEMLLKYSQEENIEIENVIIGGLSAGGILALTYTEWMNKSPHKKIPKPCAVFTVDSPVDMYNFWFVEERAIERNCSEPTVNEAKFVKEYFVKYLGGSPLQFPEAYKFASPFSRKDDKGGNAYYLKDVAVRAYCEPDIHFHHPMAQNNTFTNRTSQLAYQSLQKSCFLRSH